MDQTLLIDLHFAPSLEYFVTLKNFQNIRLEKKEHYVKQSYRNRCYIKTTHGVEMLSIPLSGKHGKVPYDQVAIDYSTRWQNVLWRTIESAYRNSPFFEHYSDDLHKILYSGTISIFDFNLQILSFCLESLKLTHNLSVTTEYEKVVNAQFSDMRDLITTRNTYLGRELYRPTPYYQVFGNSFDENLSVFDLLFCTGPQAGTVLHASSASLESKPG
jgi:WbqC-like protein family